MARSFVARLLSPLEARRHAPQVPGSWYGRQNLVPPGEVPFASGIGYVSSPFSNYFEKAWGVLPTADQARYRIIYRTVPVAHAAVDKMVEAATSKGYSLDVGKDNPAQERIKQICDEWRTAHPELDAVIQAAAKDLLVHGVAYIEPCYAETGFDIVTDAGDDARFNGTARRDLDDEQRARFDALVPDLEDLRKAGVFTKFPRYHEAFLQGLDKPGAKVERRLYDDPITLQENQDHNVVLLSRGKDQDNAHAPSQLVWLKNLDPLTMRIRRDAWGNVYGAIQYLVVPPVAFDTSKIVVGLWNPTSTYYENAYGVSLFQSLIRTQEAIWQIENDLLVIGHALAKPPYLFKRGVMDPSTGRLTSVPGDPDWAAFQSQMQDRAAGSDLFVLGNVVAEPINTQLTTAVGSLIAYLNYHKEQRVIALRVPPQLLGVPEGSTRTTAEVNQGDFLLTIQSLQASIARMLGSVYEAVLAPYADELGDAFEVPQVKWNPIMEADETIELKKILDSLNARLITMQEARKLAVHRGIFEVPLEGEEGYEEALAELEKARERAAFSPLLSGFGTGDGGA